MLITIILNDIKAAAEELSSGVASYVVLMQVNLGYEIANKTLSILIPLFTAYVVHKLRTKYWEKNRPFFKNIISDLIKLFKHK